MIRIKASLFILHQQTSFLHLFLPESKTLVALFILGRSFQPIIFLSETFEVKVLFPKATWLYRSSNKFSVLSAYHYHLH